MSDARSVGGAGPPDPPLSQLGVARRCLRAAGARHQLRAAARGVAAGSRRNELAHDEKPVLDTHCGADLPHPAEPMTRRETYLDWNATAPLRPEAVAAVTAALAHGGNPSSVHRSGRAARKRVERAREAVAALVGARTGWRDFRQRRHRGQSPRAARLRSRPHSRFRRRARFGLAGRARGRAHPGGRGRHRRSRRRSTRCSRPIRARRWSRSCWRTTRPGSCSRPPDRRDRARERRAVPLRRGAGRRQIAARCRRDRRRSGQPVGAQARRPAGDRRACR